MPPIVPVSSVTRTYAWSECADGGGQDHWGGHQLGYARRTRPLARAGCVPFPLISDWLQVVPPSPRFWEGWPSLDMAFLRGHADLFAADVEMH